ncbi:hypothetical protein FDP41_003036 [Naegleria fowleri]|uniref:Uncharacterized protein n=1 Tax=Naegleria fowleri TaxID=5763 RepID=A0A6A5BTZ2_NAEFO|nr:uncharacterized protein FDP41_003036 [Naegleria fowleri]KAF0977714.1 hypothetical protein FDP41_003036 [Naegleria fowleri]CAG4708616.1 unnamed protein product [Naegleria fowleri]
MSQNPVPLSSSAKEYNINSISNANTYNVTPITMPSSLPHETIFFENYKNYSGKPYYNSNSSSAANTPLGVTIINQGGSELISNSEVFISDCPLINQSVFVKWLQGLSIETTSKYLLEKQRSSHMEYFSKYSFFVDSYYRLITNEVAYQYRIFNDFQPYLQNPLLFMSCNTILQVAPSVKHLLIQQYFNFDERVYRELMGKKLTSKLRRDLEEISEKYDIEIISVRRQFDNLKAIFKFFKSSASCPLTDLVSLEKSDDGQTILSKIIQEKFILSERLAEKYATLVFMTYQRFETSRKFMKDFNFQDLYFLCSQILKHWTYEARSINTTSSIKPPTINFANDPSSPINISTSIEQNIPEEEPITVFDAHQIALDFIKFRDIKTVIFSDKTRLKEYVSLIITQLSNDKAFSDGSLEKIDEIIVEMLKTLLQIGQGLISAKEVRDIFIDLVEKFIEPIERIGLTGHQFFQLLEAIRECFPKISTVKPQHILKYNPTFSQYMLVIRDISVFMYKKFNH